MVNGQWSMVRNVLLQGLRPYTSLQRLQHLRRITRPHPLATMGGARPHLTLEALRRDVRPQELCGETRRRGIPFLLRREQRPAARHRRRHQRAPGPIGSPFPRTRADGKAPPRKPERRLDGKGDAGVAVRHRRASGFSVRKNRQPPPQLRRLLRLPSAAPRQPARLCYI